MNKYDKMDMNERYLDLVTAIVWQVCQDYSDVIKSGEPKELSDSYIFLMDPDNTYLDILGISGDSLAKKIEKNVEKYGKGMMTDIEWAKIREKIGGIDYASEKEQI
jgi:hypothetical protein